MGPGAAAAEKAKVELERLQASERILEDWRKWKIGENGRWRIGENGGLEKMEDWRNLTSHRLLASHICSKIFLPR